MFNLLILKAMCILIIKQMGADFPPVENIKESCQNNPDGFSMAISYNGKILTFRTMNAKTFIKEYAKTIQKYDKSETAMLIHARIATHGSKKLSNCHCWTSNGIAFAHNGILRIDNHKDKTDSQTFFDYMFIPAYVMGGLKMAKVTAESIIGTSKFGFLFENGTIVKMGNFNKESGCYYSNTSYKKREYSNFYPVDKYSPYRCPNYGSHFGSNWWNSIKSNKEQDTTAPF